MGNIKKAISEVAVRKAVKRYNKKKMKSIEVSSYTGSPDSETIADYMENFSYSPEHKAEIQEKYKMLLSLERG